MSSARKRATRQKAIAELAYLQNRLMRAEHQVQTMTDFAKEVATRSDLQYAALAELVTLEHMKGELSLMLQREEGGMGLDYDRRKPLAWAKARELLGPNWKPPEWTPAKSESAHEPT